MTGNRSNSSFFKQFPFQVGECRDATRSAARREFQCRGVDAIAQPGGRRTVREDVAQVRVADVTQDFRAHHAMTAVDAFGHVRRIERLEIAGPAAAGVELGVGFKQRRVAADAGIGAGFMVIPEVAGERALGGRMAGHLKGQGLGVFLHQPLAPLRLVEL